MNQKVSLLLLSPLKEKSGNCTTIHRINEGLKKFGYICYIRDGSSFTSKDHLKEFLRLNSVSFVLALHAFKSGKYLKDCNLPYCIIFGGTDLLENEKAFEINEVILKSKFCVAFSDSMKKKALKLWPNLKETKIYIIPQAVNATYDRYFDFTKYVIQEQTIKVNKNTKFFIIVGGVRRIKDQACDSSNLNIS